CDSDLDQSLLRLRLCPQARPFASSGLHLSGAVLRLLHSLPTVSGECFPAPLPSSVPLTPSFSPSQCGSYLAVLGFEFVLKVPYFGHRFKEADYSEYRYS